MEKQKRWQLYLIVGVLLITLYNILPTIFYYSKPLKSPINAERSIPIAEGIVDRVNQIEVDSKQWLSSFCRLIGVKPESIQLLPTNSEFFEIAFRNESDAELFKRFLPAAGAFIPFVPSQLELNTQSTLLPKTHVLVQRNVTLKLNQAELNEIFTFIPKYDEEHAVNQGYRKLVYDRAAEVAYWISGPSLVGQQILAIVNSDEKENEATQELMISLSKEIADIEMNLGKASPITKRYFASFTQLSAHEGVYQKFLAKMERFQKQLKSQRDLLKQQQEKEPLQTIDAQKLSLLTNQIHSLDFSISSLRRNSAEFQKGKVPLSLPEIEKLLVSGFNQGPSQELDLGGYNPFIKGITIHWDSGKMTLNLYGDVEKIRLQSDTSENTKQVKDRLNQALVNTIARIARSSDETFTPSDYTFTANFDQLTNSSSYLVLELGQLAKRRAQQVLDQVISSWNPTHRDLTRDSYPIHTYEAYQQLPSEEQKLGLVIYAPSIHSEVHQNAFKNSSIYLIGKGMGAIAQKYQENPEAEDNQTLMSEFSQLTQLLQGMGFIGYSGAAFNLPKEYAKDFIFELSDYASPLLKATREDFTVKGSKRYAILDFSDVEQRILTLNRIEDRVQEDLVKWYESYNSAQIDLNQTSKYTVPAPTKNVFWENFKLSLKKYFRGDDRKILKWGLDLSGGKTVRIGLLDQNGRTVTNPEDIKQAVNELYNRINKMGVAERTIRIENSNILLDFPGSQNLSAAELVKASAMYFHIVNEKFSPSYTVLAAPTNHFLQEVWNEAVVTNRTDIESINEIAWNHLGGDSSISGNIGPQSENAKILYEHGLRLSNVQDYQVSQAFDDTLSSIAMFRGTDSAEWGNQTHPLLIVFHNYALEGANLDNIQAGYDNNQGNILTFGVKRSYEGAQNFAGGSPRDDFYTWTSQFSEDKIMGTPKETYSRGRGWRMAVILNGSVVTSPSLHAALRDGGTISGRFSQREVTQLAADLKAGSLSFTPRILSEENVSPELGREERTKGIVASAVALALVVIAMIGYYRFAGLVASCAVLLNIFIMWGVLQNIGAALTLPGIAGIVLTIGMAVDANVLVFERIREEFKNSGRIASAIQTGYRKAFSAIVDSNITTIIAAVILIQFDSGPIKGFAVTLIIGILSSMFTSLFMTRYFFAGWVRNPANKRLDMAQFLKETHYNFLGQTKKAFAVSAILMILGMGLLFSERKTIFGMDFTGGYSLTVNLEEQPRNPNYRLEATNALLDGGASRRDFEIRELSRPNQLRIQFGTSMDEKGHPFYTMPEVSDEERYTYSYQQDPRLNWVVNTLQNHDVPVQASQLSQLEKNWTIMSGQFSDAMRNNAVIALIVALLSILLYITLRFEFKYAIGAVAGLAHDVIITIGVLALFHALKFPVQIDLQVVGAIMTIIGYSLNDTIIVFDRIREDLKLMKRMSFKDIINHALNVTLSRTIMTSGTTLLVLLALVLLGGQSIFSFSLVMTVGVIVGTLSSLFIASPIMLYFHNREVDQKNGSSVASTI